MSDSQNTGSRKTALKLSIEQTPADTEQGSAFHEDAAQTGPDIRDEAVGFIKGLGASAWAYASSHHYTVLYGFIGFVLAVLILTIGLWSTIVIAVFAGVGAALGQIRDGDNGIVNFFSRLFSRKR